jgi:hypothetical protein
MILELVVGCGERLGGTCDLQHKATRLARAAFTRCVLLFQVSG